MNPSAKTGKTRVKTRALQALAQLLGIILAAKEQTIEHAERLALALPFSLYWPESLHPEEQPEIAKRILNVLLESLAGEDVFKVDLVVVCGPRVGLLRVEPPELAVGEN